MKPVIVFLVVANGLFAQPSINRARVLGASTYLGGDSVDIANAIAIDKDGFVYVTGETVSSNFPTSAGAFQTRHAGMPNTIFMIGDERRSDVFVTKLTPDLSSIVYSTLIGGARRDVGRAIAVDAQGNAYVTGSTDSDNFPVTAGAFQTKANFQSPIGFFRHAFVLKLNSLGSAVVYSTLLGGGNSDDAAAIILDAAGNAYVAGATQSVDFPITKGAFQTMVVMPPNPFFTFSHGFVTKLNNTGSALIYSTYLSGSTGSSITGLAVDPAGDAFVTGSTGSPDFPTTPGAFQTSAPAGAQTRGFVSKLNTTGSALVYSTLLAGEKTVVPNAIAIDAAANAYITGATDSQQFPSTLNSYQPALRGGASAFITKVNPSGASLVYSTLFGSGTLGRAIALDAAGDAYISGQVFGDDLPLSSDAVHMSYSAAPCFHTRNAMFNITTFQFGCADAFAAKLDPAGARLMFSTFFGGNDQDSANAIALDPKGAFYIAGMTESGNLPTTTGSLKMRRGPDFGCSNISSPTAGEGFPCDDAFIAKFDLAAAPLPSPLQILNSASFLPGAIAPGELVSLTGSGIGPPLAEGIELNPDHTLVSTIIENTRVLFDAVAAPLILVSPNQINAVVPFEVDGKSAVPVQIERNAQAGSAIAAGVVAANPGIFPASFMGIGPAALLNQDWTLNRPSNPAAPGSIATLYATGLGVMEPPVPDGGVISDPASLAKTRLGVQVFVGMQNAEVLYAGTAPTLVAGVIQVNFRVPQVSGDALPLFLGVNGASSQAGITMSVQ